MDQINPKNGLCLLSLDGGGVRGLSALLILKRIMYVLDGIEEPTVKRPLLPCNYFDMIAGTSTGGLIAIMLGVLRMDVDTCISKYLEMAPQIFPTEGFVSGSKMGKLWKGIKGEARFDAGKLESYVKNLVKDHLKLVNQDVLLDFDRNAGSPASCKTFVCVTNKDTGRPFRLRNYRSSWEPSTGCTIWQAARATVAAPLFFPPVRFGHPPENYVDGGLRYNNPVRALYDEAKRVWNKSSEPRIGCVISIGTGVPPLQATGDSGKDILKSLVNIAMDTQQTANEFADEMELVTEPGNFTYIRFNVEQGLQQVGVEEWRQFDKLTGATKDYLNNHKKEVERCAMALHDLVAPSSEGKRSIFLSELPISSRQFFGRAAELGQMRGFLKLTGPETKAVVLWGLGGFGKSRIALRYIELFQREYSAVLWINALSLESALASYSNIAAEIRSRYAASIRTQQMEALEDINLVKRWLGMDENDRWLMIIDSVDDLNTFDCRQLIPACSHGTIIVTSTHSRTAVALGFKGLDIHSIDDESGSEMLLSSLAAELHGEEAIKTAKSIVKTLDDIPLAIEQAAAWLQDVGSIREFLGFYRTQYDSLMKYVPERSSWSYDKNRSIFTTFELLFQKLNMEHKAAADLLTVFSFFGPCTIPARRLFRSPTLDTTSESLSLLRISDAPESTRTKWDKAQWVDQLVSEQLSLRLAINSMEKLCLLKVRKAPSGDIISFSLHNSICRWRVETLNERERQEWAALASYLLCRTLLDPDTDFDLSTSHRVLILYSNNMLKSHIKRDSIEAPDGKLFRPYGFAMACFAPLYLEFGRTAEAEGMFKAAIDYGRVTQDSSWPADVKSLKLIKGQAELYSKMGQREKAAEALGSLLHSSTKLLGDMDQMTIWTAGKLRDIREAKLSYANNEHRALEASAGSKLGTTSSTEHGSNHIRYPVPENVADVPDEEYVFLQVLQQTTDEFGERDEDTRKAVQQLAIYYRSQRRFLEAQKLLERLWEEDQVGGFHKAKSETLHYVVDLVECYKATGAAGLLELLITEGADVNVLDELELTALHWAARRGRPDMARLLLNGGADPKASSSYGETPLLFASWQGDAAIVQMLLEHHVDIEASELRFGTTPLMAAALEGHAEVVHLLLNGQAHINTTSADGQTALHEAAAGGHRAIVRPMLQHQAGIDTKDDAGITALHAAAKRGKENTVQILLGHGADANTKTNRDRITPLHYAALRGHEAVVRLLLEAKANADVTTEDGYSPLHNAALNGHEAIVGLLLEHDANVNLLTPDGHTAIYKAAFNGHVAVVRRLLESHAELNVAGSSHTPLHAASGMGHDQIIRLLLAYKADVNVRTSLGWERRTPLHSAAKYGHETSVSLLLESGADRDAKTSRGRTPLDWAILYGHTAVVDLLKAHGARSGPR